MSPPPLLPPQALSLPPWVVRSSMPFPPQPAALTQGMGVSDGVTGGASSKPALSLKEEFNPLSAGS